MLTSERSVETEQPDVSPVTARQTWSMVGLVASTMVILIEVLRTLYPLGYALVGDLGFVVTPALLVVVFLSPLLLILLHRVGGRTKLVAGIAALAGMRVVLQLLTPPPLWAAVLATAIGLVAITLVLAAALERPGGASATALGFVLAMGADAALKGSFAAWDRVWQRGMGPLSVTLAVCAVTIWFLLQAVRAGAGATAEPRRGRLGRVFAVAVLVMPAVMMLESIAFIGSASGAGLAPTALVTIGGAALAVVATSAAGASRVRRIGGLVAAVALATVVWAMTSATGPTAMALAVLGQSLLGVLLVALLADEPTDREHTGLVRTAVGSTLGFVTMFVLTLLYPLHYEMPLPIDNTLLPALAVVVATFGLLARRDPTREPDTGGVTIVRSLVAAAALGIVAGGVALLLTLTAHEPTTLADGRFPLVVASFNMDQGATGSGAVDFRAAADVIDGLDADLIALQEVPRGWSLSGMNDFAAWLEQTEGTVQHFAPAADRQFGNMIVTRVTLGTVETLDLPQGDGSMRRSAIVATIPTADGTVTTFSVHLQHRNSAGSIEARRLELQRVLDEWGGAPRTIVMGDFNVDNQPAPDGEAKLLVGPSQSNTLQPLLDAGFTTTQPTERCTMPTSNDNCSDYVLVTPDLALEPPVEVLEQGAVGDHHPIAGSVVRVS